MLVTRAGAILRKYIDVCNTHRLSGRMLEHLKQKHPAVAGLTMDLGCCKKQHVGVAV